MEITEVRVFPVRDNRLRAYVSITLDGCFVIRDLKVIQGDSGLFVAMPARRREDGTYRDIAHPLNSETRSFMEEKVLGAYRSHLEELDEMTFEEEGRRLDKDSTEHSDEDKPRAASAAAKRGGWK